MPVFFSNFSVPVSSSGGDFIHAVLQNPTLGSIKAILFDFDFNFSIPTFEVRRFTAAATLTPIAGRPPIGGLDSVSASPGAIVATAQSDTISPNGSVDLSVRVFDVTTQRSLFPPLSILVPPSTCLGIYTVDQVGLRNVVFRLSWTEPR